MSAEASCPLCGKPNACARRCAGDADAPCWCESVVIPAEVLERVPDDQRNLACLCADCVAATRTL
jgi:hypothetical protein